MNLKEVIRRGTRAAQPAAATVGEGTLYYVTDENKTERSSGAAWQDCSDSGAATTAPGLVLLASLTASASASLDFTIRNASGQSGAIFQSDYDEYMIELVGIVPATDNVDFLMRMSTDGGSSYDSGTNYSRVAQLNNITTAFFQGADSGLSSITLATGIDTTVTQATLNASMRLFQPGSTTRYKTVIYQGGYLNNDGKNYVFSGQGRYHSTTAVNAFRFITSSGNIADGTIRVYGVKK